jgi:hypothetical protein
MSLKILEFGSRHRIIERTERKVFITSTAEFARLYWRNRSKASTECATRSVVNLTRVNDEHWPRRTKKIVLRVTGSLDCAWLNGKLPVQLIIKMQLLREMKFHMRGSGISWDAFKVIYALKNVSPRQNPSARCSSFSHQSVAQRLSLALNKSTSKV